MPLTDTARICFAHAAYDMKPIFDRLCPGIATVQVTDYAALKANVPEADVLVVKHRNGPTKDLTLGFQGHYARFANMAGSANF